MYHPGDTMAGKVLNLNILHNQDPNFDPIEARLTYIISTIESWELEEDNCHLDAAYIRLIEAYAHYVNYVGEEASESDTSERKTQKDQENNPTP